MLLRVYREMSLPNRELILKLFLCTLISACYSYLVGDIYSVTAVVTANLLLYVDRGYCGTIRYASRRILAQIVQGALVLVAILPCKYWLHLPVPDIVLFTVASLFGIAVGMPINYKHQFSPLYATLANATFIIAIDALIDWKAFPYRVIHCIAGAVIGYVVNFILMPQRDRYKEAEKRALFCTELSLKGRSVPIAGADCRQSEEYRRCKQLLNVDIPFILQDHEKGLKRHRQTQEALAAVRTVYQLLEVREDMLSALGCVSSETMQRPECQQALSCLEYAEKAHLELVRAWADERQPDKSSLPAYTHICPDEDFVIFSSCLIQYIRLLRSLEETLLSAEPSPAPEEKEMSPCGAALPAPR